MSEDRKGTRSQEHRIEIDAPPEAVWRAITEAEEVTRWYVVDAEIDGRVGGTYRVSWGEGMDGVSDIRTFEPGRRLRIEHRPLEGGPEPSTGPIVEEYTLERAGEGRTILTLVTSGIPEAEDWDWFFDGTKRGWGIFLASLRHYLERHAGTPRDHVVEMVSLPGSCEEAWARFAGSGGLRLAEELGDAEAGDRYATTTAFGEDLEGRVLLVDPPYRLLATVEGLNDALLAATLEQMGPSNFLYLSISLFGVDREVVEKVRVTWLDWVSALFPTGDAPTEAFQGMLEDLSNA